MLVVHDLDLVVPDPVALLHVVNHGISLPALSRSAMGVDKLATCCSRSFTRA